MSKFSKRLLFLALGCACASMAMAKPAMSNSKVQLFNRHSIKPNVVTDAQCQMGPDVIKTSAKSNKFKVGNLSYSNGKYKLKSLKNGLRLSKGSYDLVVHGKDNKVLYKAKLIYKGVGTKGVRGSYGAYTDGYCAGNYISSYSS